MFKIEFENNDELIIYPYGELDIYTTPKFKEEVMDKYKKELKDIVIDGENLEYLDSTGLGAFIYILNEIKKDGKKLATKNLKPSIKKLFTITKLDKVFEMR